MKATRNTARHTVFTFAVFSNGMDMTEQLENIVDVFTLTVFNSGMVCSERKKSQAIVDIVFTLTVFNSGMVL
jgi:hypothetical protein